jgi:hypothetical protein
LHSWKKFKMLQNLSQGIFVNAAFFVDPAILTGYGRIRLLGERGVRKSRDTVTQGIWNGVWSGFKTGYSKNFLIEIRLKNPDPTESSKKSGSHRIQQKSESPRIRLPNKAEPHHWMQVRLRFRILMRLRFRSYCKASQS